MVLLRVGCAAVLLMLASCWTPVFNQDLSVAELVRGKLTEEFDHTVSLNNGSTDGDLLQAGVSFDGTTWAVISSNHNQVSLTASNISGNAGTQLDIPLADPSQVMIQPDRTGVDWYIPTAIHNGGGSGDVNDITSSNFYSDLWLADPSSVIGFATLEDAGQNISAYYLLKTASSPYTVTLNQDNNGGLVSPAPFSNVGYSGSGGWMAVNPAGATGIVVYLTHAPDTSGQYVTDMIDATGPIASWKGHDHVAGFLSTGRLLTREGSFYNVCDTGGKILYSFPAGTLQFSGEYLDSVSLTMRVRFVEAILQSSQNGGQDKVRVRAYSIPTSKLDSLQ